MYALYLENYITNDQGVSYSAKKKNMNQIITKLYH